jgi:cyd operon protein YbgT
MWYFTWILGVLFACSCGIINVLWLEHENVFQEEKKTWEQIAIPAQHLFRGGGRGGGYIFKFRPFLFLPASF